MKFSYVSKTISIIVIGIAALNISLNGQTWSPEQKEVLKAVDTVWQKWMKGDWSFMSEDFVGWNTQFHAPYTKDDSTPWMERFHEKNKKVLYDFQPLAIEIHGNVAIAFYTYRLLLEDKDGKETTEEGRWIDTYKKENGKWMLIAESGHVTSSK